jgi:pentose-5-phosphate-3-epimerase
LPSELNTIRPAYAQRQQGILIAMGIIVPAIIPTSFNDLSEKLKVLEGLSTDVQIDIVDGVYAKPASWPYLIDSMEPLRMLRNGELFPGAGETHFEVDLMSADPESTAGTWIGLGANRLTIHAASTRHVSQFFESMRTLLGHDKDFMPRLLSLGIATGGIRAVHGDTHHRASRRAI